LQGYDFYYIQTYILIHTVVEYIYSIYIYIITNIYIRSRMMMEWSPELGQACGFRRC
jgi:hypothetical protein